ncbi:MAG: N-acetylglucosamine kinase [Cyclobacteriaceae bacterium]
MILIADSGSTKTAWRLIDDNRNIHQFTTAGMNPVHLEKDKLLTILHNELLNEEFLEPASVTRLYFYGAGCIPGNAGDRMQEVLADVFKTAEIEVADDMLAVARGVCGHEPGIACILGTGSNSCLFDGSEIIEKVPALGFILGDEGSGSWLGKEFLAAFMRRELPSDLNVRFNSLYGLDRTSRLESVYSGVPLSRIYISWFTGDLQLSSKIM